MRVGAVVRGMELDDDGADAVTEGMEGGGVVCLVVRVGVGFGVDVELEALPPPNRRNAAATAASRGVIVVVVVVSAAGWVGAKGRGSDGSPSGVALELEPVSAVDVGVGAGRASACPP